jgi:phosphoribosylformylglycinamidine cyclo-ligase
MNYKESGVDIEAGNAFVENIKKKAPTIGGFNGMMKVPSRYKNPVLVSGADGVGTKLKIAQLECGGPDKSAMYGIGLDLVAMCVNDVITCGARPLYFLDYISTSKLNQEYLTPLMDGILEGCKQSGMDLLGGETAEHPQHVGYAEVIRDLAGFCTGIVEEDKIIDGSKIQPGDVVIGIESNGIHSNGFSLIERLLFHHKLFLTDTPELLKPTTIYAPLIMYLLRKKRPIHGMAHITGGGIVENLPRCLPPGLKANIDYNSWPLPKLFNKIMLAGEIPEEEMKRVFNLGIGFCLIVPRDSVIDTEVKIWGHDLKSWTIGEIVV